MLMNGVECIVINSKTCDVDIETRPCQPLSKVETDECFLFY